MESFLTNMSVAARCALADNIIDAMGTPSKIVMSVMSGSKFSISTRMAC